MAKRKGKEKSEKKSREIYIVYDYENDEYSVMGDGVEDGGIEHYDPAEFPDCLVDILETSRETVNIWFYGLSLVALDIIKVLYHMGMMDMTGNNVPIKQWQNMMYDYTTATTGTTYRMRMKVHGKRTITMYDPVNILGKLLDNIIRDYVGPEKTGMRWMDRAIALKNAVQCVVYSGRDPKSLTMKRIPYTISMVANRQWRTLSEFGYGDPGLVDCYSVQAYDGDLDKYLRDAYRGGWCYMDDSAPVYNGDGIVLDVNSLYPYIMATKSIPFGDPILFQGEPPKIAYSERMYYFVHVKCSFSLKDGYLPYIGLHDWIHQWGLPLRTSDIIDDRGQQHSFYEKDGKKERVLVELTVSKTDWEEMLKVYDVQNIEYIDGVIFGTTRFAFKDFVRVFYEQKKTAREHGDRAQERTAKMILNSASGVLAKIKEREGLKYIIEDDGSIDTEIFKTSSQSKSYIHMAAAILAYARQYIYEYAVAHKDRFLYSDTDSLHLKGKEIPDDVKVSDKMGDFKVEHEFDNARYFKRKMYILVQNGKFMITAAGISREYKEYIEDFFSSYIDEMHHFWIPGKFLSSAYRRHFKIQDRDKDSFLRFEKYISEIKTIPQLLDEIEDCPLPNGERICEDFSSRLMTKWVNIV